ncbi:hypothetical protein PHYBLDRAFT_146316 [Phycomyces blakesleeanus NRRL 1555(-)]|uniref:TFIIS N-terminal domain-containing protein n=1 Tax=Phycomyces blakesleeanus (strain ATCC 8743b / DSM 1359 / FGSC 10004 / NBRC 33097 / NRRL 1555) TaxID=763407 RepID=A0A162U2Q1_PHYB8|nr:hypothetical protein PHYBLDRAFT_146316 [Phycomyces blakesleeanus NRRL 1555(-)]OAD73002.1 hypothetical protein PHYBLDRAFT_146316 [Phycomyces blakesleeanus NRRL 1555(-)]|eukprot:XP_018291042.1 hypothetical protein PHYBLDRAFT_146316 [Phycomyces blakesleeanus NRRL 1555(-)]
MSSDEDTRPTHNEPTFNYSDDGGELSDLEDEQYSDGGHNDDGRGHLGNVHDDLPPEPVAASIHKLPSFKKRDRNISAEESVRLEQVRKELRDQKAHIVENDEPEEIDPQQALRDEIDQHFARALASGKKKRKKVDEDDLERSMDEELANMRDAMKSAAEYDAVSNGQRKPAVAKLKMLSQVTSMLTNKHLQDSILDNQLLDSIRLWLEPLPDRSLPSLDIQTEMLDILEKLPIGSDHLRESGVGKIVYFYTKSPRVEMRIRRKADQLVAKWSRLVIKRSENYRERRHELREYTQDDRQKYRPDPVEEEGDEKRLHVRIPQAVAADYDIAPQSTVRVDKVKSRPDNSSFRRLKNTMRAIKTGPKRSTPKVSIEGKNLGT